MNDEQAPPRDTDARVRDLVRVFLAETAGLSDDHIEAFLVDGVHRTTRLDAAVVAEKSFEARKAILNVVAGLFEEARIPE